MSDNYVYCSNWEDGYSYRREGNREWVFREPGGRMWTTQWGYKEHEMVDIMRNAGAPQEHIDLFESDNHFNRYGGNK